MPNASSQNACEAHCPTLEVKSTVDSVRVKGQYESLAASSLGFADLRSDH